VAQDIEGPHAPLVHIEKVSLVRHFIPARGQAPLDGEALVEVEAFAVVVEVTGVAALVEVDEAGLAALVEVEEADLAALVDGAALDELVEEPEVEALAVVVVDAGALVELDELEELVVLDDVDVAAGVGAEIVAVELARMRDPSAFI